MEGWAVGWVGRGGAELPEGWLGWMEGWMGGGMGWEWLSGSSRRVGVNAGGLGFAALGVVCLVRPWLG